jgi:hypothetical protein
MQGPGKKKKGRWGKTREGPFLEVDVSKAGHRVIRPDSSPLHWVAPLEVFGSSSPEQCGVDFCGTLVWDTSTSN